MQPRKGYLDYDGTKPSHQFLLTMPVMVVQRNLTSWVCALCRNVLMKSVVNNILLIKSPPASGKSRALMFVALDKLNNQGVNKAIIVVPEKSIGSSFNDEPLVNLVSGLIGSCCQNGIYVMHLVKMAARSILLRPFWVAMNVF